MFSLVGISLVVNVLLLVVLVYLFILRLVDKGVIDNLASKIKVREAEIKSLNKILGDLAKEGKLYTFRSAFDHVEDVIRWRKEGQQLLLSLKNGSLFVVDVPSRYQLVSQDQSEEEPSE